MLAKSNKMAVKHINIYYLPALLLYVKHQIPSVEIFHHKEQMRLKYKHYSI